MIHNQHQELEELEPLQHESSKKLGELELRVHSIEELARDQSLMMERRFNELGRSLERLADQLLKIVPVGSQDISTAISAPSAAIQTTNTGARYASAARVANSQFSPTSTELDQNQQPDSTQDPERNFVPDRLARSFVKPQATASRRLSFQNDKIASEWAKIEGIRPTSSMLLDDADRISPINSRSDTTSELTSADMNEAHPAVGNFQPLSESPPAETPHDLVGDQSKPWMNNSLGARVEFATDRQPSPAEESSTAMLGTISNADDTSETPALSGASDNPPMFASSTSPDVDEAQPTIAAEKIEAPSSLSTMVNNVTTEEARSDTVPDLESEKPKQESVAELLARLKAEGQWNGIEDESQTATTATTTRTPTTFSPPAPPAKASVNAIKSSISSGAGDDVDDYMAQLLARMRGNSGPAQSTAKPSPKISHSESTTSSSSPLFTTDETPLDQFGQPVTEIEHPEVMRAEDYVPKQKAEKIQSLDKMRELANSMARTAVASSEEQRRQALAYMQLGIGVAALAMSGYYFGVSMKTIGDTSCIIGVVCLAMAGFLGFRFHTTLNAKPTETE